MTQDQATAVQELLHPSLPPSPTNPRYDDLVTLPTDTTDPTVAELLEVYDV